MTIIELNRKRKTVRNKVSKVKNFFNSFQPTDSTKDYIALKSKLDNIKRIIKELDILQNYYCALPDKVNLKDSLDTLSDLQDEAEETKVSLLVLLSNYESKKETVNNTSKNNHVKLPDLPLPTFSGKFQEFEQFKLQFMNRIGSNPSLNEAQKLCYLKGALKNEASLIQSDQDTFDLLMKSLEVRYENTRALVDIHIAEILSINKLNSEIPSQIRSIIDKRKKMIASSSTPGENSKVNTVCASATALPGLRMPSNSDVTVKRVVYTPSALAPENSNFRSVPSHFHPASRKGDSFADSFPYCADFHSFRRLLLCLQGNRVR
ncbi:uncharacterized protein TNCV_1386891 [Trichonephila clavipes]|nr:uncharacterized protein TNCV_1386891 [Trichonephila clavipes]